MTIASVLSFKTICSNIYLYLLLTQECYLQEMNVGGVDSLKSVYPHLMMLNVMDFGNSATLFSTWCLGDC